jgi:protein tyrosine/serine phosphatase
MIKFSHQELRKVFQFLSNRERLPTLIHCTFGKDRTGVVVALIQLTVGVPRATIIDEYLKSAAASDARALSSKVDFMQQIGLSPQFSGVSRDAIEAVLDWYVVFVLLFLCCQL